ncbi:MAG: hypothetical protein FJW30_12365 [Acidobacteria bacterium]|nr:hypothetical protein [Acidobacteriota bacterium]
MRVRFGYLHPVILGAALLALICLYKCGSNVWSYLRMREIPVEVVAAKLKIDVTDQQITRELPEPFYVLNLHFKATGGSGREIYVEEELANAFFPDEALDEFRIFAPGTQHRIYSLRGQAREIRLPGYSTTNPEVTFAIAWFVLFGFLVVTVVSAGIADQGTAVRLFRPWLALLVFGIPPLFGAVAFGWVETAKRYQYLTVDPKVTQLPKGYMPALPPNVEISETARAYFTGREGDTLLEYSWNGRRLHGVIGQDGAPHDILRNTLNSAAGTCRFYISPVDRWGIAKSLAFDAEFWAPLGILVLFGVLFTGAGFLVRKFFQDF